jgi:KUP system potassium uptake protein
MRERWGWSLTIAWGVAALFLVIDVAFVGANLLKIADGGWFSLVMGGLVFTLMSTWWKGRELLARRVQTATEPLERFFRRIAAQPPRSPELPCFSLINLTVRRRHWCTTSRVTRHCIGR